MTMGLDEAEIKGAVTSTGSLVSVLKSRAPKTALLIASTQFVYPHIKNLYKKYRNSTSFTIIVEATDELYDDLHEWALSLLPVDKRRSLTAYSTHNDSAGKTYASPMDVSDDGRPSRGTVRFRYSGDQTQTIVVDGNDIDVKVADGDKYHEGGRMFFSRPPQIVFTAHSKEGRDALHRQMETLLAKRNEVKRNPTLRMAKSWGDWHRMDSIASRSLESVVLREGQRDALVEDLDSFLKSESEYVRRCIPWHRGYLFSGPPGTGKTSSALALANHFDLDVYYLPLADAKKDSNLIELVGSVTSRSLLLLEDVDVFHATTERTEGEDSITLSGVLNALDGIATPHGLITIMTTNNKDALDSALIRPGRIDREENFELADAKQAINLFQWFFQRRWDDWDDAPISSKVRDQFSYNRTYRIAPAEIIGVMHRYKDDPIQAQQAIMKLGKSEEALVRI